MIPIYLFYSMFGFQRVGDLAWLLGDIRGRGILAGCTAGRTTLQGEGLQHDDGHSPLLASVNPAARIYDPAFAYEIAVIMEEAVRSIVGPDPIDEFWYLTLYNENYVMPAMDGADAAADPAADGTTAVRDGVLRGLYRFAGPAEARGDPADGGRHATLLFSGPSWQAVMEARQMLAEEWGVSADAWSVTSYSELRRDGMAVERWNRLHPGEPARAAYVAGALGEQGGPVVAVSDYLRAVPDQITSWVPRDFTVLGTDGFGRSGTRGALRRFFEVDAGHVVVAVLAALARCGQVSATEVASAIARHDIDTSAADPWAP
jgi:pyruvate dehydrogenase E1 component